MTQPSDGIPTHGIDLGKGDEKGEQTPDERNAMCRQPGRNEKIDCFDTHVLPAQADP